MSEEMVDWMEGEPRIISIGGIEIDADTAGLRRCLGGWGVFARVKGWRDMDGEPEIPIDVLPFPAPAERLAAMILAAYPGAYTLDAGRIEPESRIRRVAKAGGGR